MRASIDFHIDFANALFTHARVCVCVFIYFIWHWNVHAYTHHPIIIGSVTVDRPFAAVRLLRRSGGGGAADDDNSIKLIPNHGQHTARLVRLPHAAFGPLPVSVCHRSDPEIPATRTSVCIARLRSPQTGSTGTNLQLFVLLTHNANESHSY